MSQCRTCVAALVSMFLVLVFSALSYGQANVNEGLETASLYVDGSKGSDSNAGTQLQPLKTIAKAASLAMSKNQQGVGTRVIINPGTYRESISIYHNSRNTNRPITFQAANAGTVVISGADVWGSWAVSGNLYTHPWSYRWGYCPAQPSPAPLQQLILRRREMIIVNGTPMTQVLSKDAMQPGTFWVDESGGTVAIWPPSGTNMSSARVEVATRPSLLSSNESNMVLRGLTFQYGNSCRGASAVTIAGADNVLVDNSMFNQNNATGLWMSNAQHFTVRSSIANRNGQKGFATYKVKYGSWQTDTGNYNNWRGAQAAFYTFDAGSFRLFLDHNSTFTNISAAYNQTQGIHFDTDNENATITGFVAVKNLYGLLVERSQGPIMVQNSYFCGNNVQGQTNSGGLDLRDSTYVTSSGNTFYGNKVNQITLNGGMTGSSEKNWETGQTYNLINEHMTLTGNIVATQGSADRVFYDSYLDGRVWTDFVTTLRSNNNRWSAGNSTPFMVPLPKKGSLTSFSGWKNLTLQDLNSTWGASPAAQPAKCAVSADKPDFWLLTSNTPNAVMASVAGQAVISLNTASLGGLTGTANLKLTGVSGIPGGSASLSTSSMAIPGSAVLTLSTKPTTPPGTYPVTIIANHGNLTRTVTVSMTLPKTSLRLSTTSLTFAARKVGTTSSAERVTLMNIGSTGLSINNISAGKDFTQTNNCGSRVSAGASCTINVTFSPTYIGTPRSTLTISAADPMSPAVVTLTGTGLHK
jgi:Right handed beta helix region/Abnormal spindle-like microcephaly-assoc'd, ASPM-SPD-2-Hydin